MPKMSQSLINRAISSTSFLHCAILKLVFCRYEKQKKPNNHNRVWRLDNDYRRAKNKVDTIWDTIWTGGITSPITVLEQITYLLFMKLLDDNQLKTEANASILGVPLKNKVFQDGICVISENPHVETDYKNLRWNVFHNFEPGEMLTNIQNYVFPFIKTIGEPVHKSLFVFGGLYDYLSR